MFPSPQTLTVLKSSTLREFIEGLGSEYLYAYDQRVIAVLVNGVRLWPSARLKSGDKVAIVPIVTGG